MPDDSDIKYETVTSASQLRPPKPRHRVKVTMEEWAYEGSDGKQHVPVFWATQMSGLEWSQFQTSLEIFDEQRGWYTSIENDQVHFLAFGLCDHAGHRIWQNLEEARKQLGEYPREDLDKLTKAVREAQSSPRAEGNDGRSKKTPSDKPSGTSPSEPGTPALIGT